MFLLEHIILLFHLWIALPALSALWQILGCRFSSKSEPALFCSLRGFFLKSKPVQKLENTGITKKVCKYTQQQHLDSTTTNSSKQPTANNMSLRQWNSVAERARLQRYVLLAEMMLEEEEDDDSSDDDDSSEEASGGELMDMEMDFIDQELSFITDIDDDNDDEEEEGDEEHDTADHVIRSTMDYFNFIYRPILDETIDFDKPPLKISDLDDSKAILDFRFRKDDLQEIADSLWPKLEPFLEGTRDKIMCENQYQCPYETGLLLVLYRLARPRRIRPELETYFRDLLLYAKVKNSGHHINL